MNKKNDVSNNLLILFLILLLFSCRSEIATTTDDGSTEIKLHGIVQDHSGLPVPDIQLSVDDQSITTDEDGRFELERIPSAPVMIRLHGPQGIGHYVLELEDTADEIDLTYPVVTKVVLLHDNDLHFNFNRQEDFKEKVKEIRERYENVWLLNAGDIFVRHAHRWAIEDTSYYAETSLSMIEMMNEAEYDVAVAGNHELDYVGDYTGLSLRSAEFPFLAANIDAATTALPHMKPFVVFQTQNGMSVAILGLSTVNFEKPGVTARDPVETSLLYRNLAHENDLFVTLNHIGFTSDQELAKAIPEIDVIVGGHSHTLLESAKLINGVLIAHAGGPPPEHQVDPDWPKYLGKIKVVFHNDSIVEKFGRVITIGTSVEVE